MAEQRQPVFGQNGRLGIGRGDFPQPMFQTARAHAADERARLRVGELLRDAIHARLPPERLAQDDGRQLAAHVAEPDAGHRGVEIIERHPHGGGVRQHEPPAAHEIRRGLERAEISRRVEIRELPRGFRIFMQREVGAPGVFRVAQLPALMHMRDADLADAFAAAHKPVGERCCEVAAHAVWAASKAATCCKITSANSGSVPMALA